MPKVKWGIDTDEPEDLEQFDVYDGPEPPVGVYQGVIRRLQVKENRNGDDMINGLFIIKEPKGSPKAKFNGFGIWFNQNITDQGKRFLKPFLTAVGVTWQEFVSKTITADDERPTNIMKIGKVKFNDGSSEPECRVQTKRGKDQNDQPQVQIRSWLPPREEESDDDWDSDDEDDDDSDSSKPPF